MEKLECTWNSNTLGSKNWNAHGIPIHLDGNATWVSTSDA